MKTGIVAGFAITLLCLMALGVTAASAAGQQYTMNQTLSDRGQQATIAFDGLAFLTGDACSDTFLPPGKVADYAGFQYLRDNDATGMGHNTDFVTRVSDNVLFVLNDQQRAQFSALAKTEEPLTTQYAWMRYPLMKAFRAQMNGSVPAGSAGLNRSAVMAYSAQLYAADANISIGRAKVYASVIRSLNQSQRAYLDRLKSGGMAAMPVVNTTAILRDSGQGNPVAMRTYASEMFAWYAGSVTSDVYFCPERQATYFGSFYLKDRPAMGNAGYSISTTLTGDSGEAFLALLTDTQRQQVTSLVDLQRADLNGIVAKRTAIATELRKALAGGTINETAVRSLSARYGELDGGISYLYATHFAEVARTLTPAQKQQMVSLRNLDGYTCSGAYLYSQQVAYPQNIPSDFLFGAGSYNRTQMAAWIASLQGASANSPAKNPDKGTGNVTKGPGDNKAPGNVTVPKQGQGGPAGNATRKDPAAAGQGPAGRMPVEETIARLAQAGYDTSGVQAAVATGDREDMKAWMREFKQKNPGIAEAIEGKGSAGAGSSCPLS